MDIESLLMVASLADVLRAVTALAPVVVDDASSEEPRAALDAATVRPGR